MPYFKNFQTKNKFRAIKTEYRGGSYDSKKEAQYAMYLDSELRAGRIKSWEKHKRIDLYGENKTKICAYVCDFVIERLDGVIEYLDVKSKITETPVFRIKWKMLQDKFKAEIKRGEIVLTIQY